jgi:CelD/BcsL family acetyltransferase involved in cellulose biosynthesis
MDELTLDCLAVAQTSPAASMPSRDPAKPLELTLEVVTHVEGLGSLATDYERLQRVSANVLPFALHDWHVVWCNHLLRSSKHVHAQPVIYAVRDAAGACRAIVPMILTRRSLGPVVVRALDMLGPDPAITEIRMPLVEPGCEGPVAAAVQRELVANQQWDWVHWTGITETFGAALAANADLHWHEPQLDYVLDLPPSWELLRARLRRNIRESLRHCYNSLTRDGLTFELAVAKDGPAVQHALGRFFALHAARAQLNGGVEHADHFARPMLRRFLSDVCDRLARRGAVCVFEMMIGGKVVASRIGFVVGDSLYLYYSGFDPAWSKYSVMTTTLAEAIKYAIAEKLTTVNLSPGTDVSKTRWSPRAIELGNAVQVARSLKSRIAYNLYQRAKSQAGLPSWLADRFAERKRNWD